MTGNVSALQFFPLVVFSNRRASLNFEKTGKSACATTAIFLLKAGGPQRIYEGFLLAMHFQTTGKC